jgi:hypothetical protein
MVEEKGLFQGKTKEITLVGYPQGGPDLFLVPNLQILGDPQNLELVPPLTLTPENNSKVMMSFSQGSLNAEI